MQNQACICIFKIPVNSGNFCSIQIDLEALLSNQSSSLVTAPEGLRALFALLSSKITNGPMSGFRWRLLSGGKLFRVLKGVYEPDQTNSFVREVKPGDCVFDVGAHVGWYTLLSSKLVADSGKVFAFEANPRNYWYLERHIQSNGLSQNVEAIHLGLSDKKGIMYFQSGTGTGTGHLAESGEVCVETSSIDLICEEKGCAPTHIKIDVEGGEVEVLRGAARTIQHYKPVIFLSTHGADIKAECIRYLTDLGYSFESMSGTKDISSEDFLCRPIS